MKVIWTPEAKESFNANLDHLLKDWGNQVTSDFLNRVDEVVWRIQSNPLSYPAFVKDVRRCVVVKQISLYYRIVSQEQIDLITFWNNHQDPERLIV